jgi:hypothetical protein
MFKNAIHTTLHPRRTTRLMNGIVWCLVLLFVCVAVSKANAQTCITYSQADDMADKASAAIVHLTPEQARIATTIYDQIPPATTSNATNAALVFLPAGGAILVGPTGMYCGSARILPDSWDGIVNRILGLRS